MARLTLALAATAILLAGASAADTKAGKSADPYFKENTKSAKDAADKAAKNAQAKAKDAQAAAKMSESRLTPAPVCASLKDAAKSYSSCASFRAGICETVQADNCDM